MKKAIVWVAIVAVIAVVIGLVIKPSGGGVKNIDAAGVTAAKANGAQIVDVRSAGEFEMGHIPGAINVPVDEVQATAASWDKDASYVVYCATGSRSAAAVATMQSLGFKNIDHFNQGIQAWTGELEKGAASAAPAGAIQTSGKPVFIEFYTNS